MPYGVLRHCEDLLVALACFSKASLNLLNFPCDRYNNSLKLSSPGERPGVSRFSQEPRDGDSPASESKCSLQAACSIPSNHPAICRPSFDGATSSVLSSFSFQVISSTTVTSRKVARVEMLLTSAKSLKANAAKRRGCLQPLGNGAGSVRK